MSDDKQITRYVHKGEPVYRAGDLKITIAIDVAMMREWGALFEQARRATAGMAVPLSRLNRPPDERNVVDQEPTNERQPTRA